ncbi:MAG TPA: DUF4124 domain-containing protein [Usitatibacter sp.]|nr:DUF4124 domain-containing protein [Usitatibacter sp.]
MKTVWIASCALLFSSGALAETTIYKLVDESGRVTYSNKPMKGATVMELEPITTLPTPPAVLAAKVTLLPETPKPTAKPAVATLTPVQATSLASIDVQTQKRRDDARRGILADELSKEQQALEQARDALAQEQRNPALLEAVRVAQNAVDPTPAQQQQFRENIDKASGRIRGLQATVAEHEKNVEALQKELGALKP